MHLKVECCEYSGDYNELLYLRSRFYAPAPGRFTTKDSWQGDYGRPLSLNRWMYTEANPISYTDPSGYFPLPYIHSLVGNTVAPPSVSFGGNISSLLLIANYDSCGNNQADTASSLSAYGVELVEGTGGLSGGWTTDRKKAVLDGVSAVGSAFARVFRGKPEFAFQLIYKTYSRPLVFVWGDKLEGMPYWEEKDPKTGRVLRSEHIGAGCLTKGSVTVKGRDVQVIKCVSLSGHLSKDIERMRNNVVHELGHLFQAATERWGIAEASRPYEKLALELNDENSPFLRDRDQNSFSGFADEAWRLNWQQHRCLPADAPGWMCQNQSEIFGDQFLGWTFNQWQKGTGPNGWSDAGEARASWMTTNMSIWLNYMRNKVRPIKTK